MGRLQHLERMALGRSAFQPLPETSEPGEDDHRPDSDDNATNIYRQQYDSKGRPTCPEIDAQKAQLRHASNSVLALVGVVERKESADAKLQVDMTLKRSMREVILTQEDGRGQEWGALAEVVGWFALWWPATLVRRIQIGLYSTNLPFMDILRIEANMIFGHGWRGILLGLLPGAGIAILHKVTWQVLALTAEESIGAIQNRIVASNTPRRQARRLIRSLTILVDVLLVAIDVLLLPLETYALSRQLNLAAPTPWRPLFTAHLPSFTRASYKTTFASPASFLTTSAPYLIGYSLLTRDPSPEAPAFSDLTSHRLPAISEPISASTLPPSSPLLDPFGTILHYTWTIRQKFLHLAGWRMYETHRAGATHGFETDVHYGSAAPESYDLGVVSHRSTALARLPATWLGMRVDMFLVKMLLLPVEAAVMRKVAREYLASGMPLTGAVAGSGVGESVWGMRSGQGGWEGLGGHLSQLGLAMAVNLGVEAACFACVYALTRKQGIGSFGWKYQEENDDEGRGGR